MTVAPHVKPLEATNKLILAALRAEPKENEHNKFIGYCPVHETVHSNPSLLIYENASGYLGFSCLSRKCDGKEIIAQIKHKFGLAVPYPSKRVEAGSGTVNKVVNYPAHEATLPLKYRKPDDIIYEYHYKWIRQHIDPTYCINRSFDKPNESNESNESNEPNEPNDPNILYMLEKFPNSQVVEAKQVIKSREMEKNINLHTWYLAQKNVFEHDDKKIKIITNSKINFKANINCFIFDPYDILDNGNMELVSNKKQKKFPTICIVKNKKSIIFFN